MNNNDPPHRSIEAMFQEKSTGAFEVQGDPYRRAKDPNNGKCFYDKIKDGNIIVGIGSFVKVLVPPDYDNETRVMQFPPTAPWIEYIAWLEAVEIEVTTRRAEMSSQMAKNSH